MQQTALSLLQERVAGSESHQLAEGLAATEASLAEAQGAAEAAQAKKKELVALAKVSAWLVCGGREAAAGVCLSWGGGEGGCWCDETMGACAGNRHSLDTVRNNTVCTLKLPQADRVASN
jgi:hypothetical protein